MKKLLSLLTCALLLSGCANASAPDADGATTPLTAAAPAPGSSAPAVKAPDYTSRFDTVTEIVLSDEGITVNGSSETGSVFTSNDIVYYEDRDTYDSGNPYGEGTDADKHTADEAAAHTVVNITAPGAYRISGKLSAGQIRVDLGKNAYEDPDAIAEIILADADITCTVAPAILFLNTYECDGMWSVEEAKPEADTSAAGANLILEGSSTVNGAYVAKIFKDKDGEKKLWKQDGAIYSYMSLNVYGPGSLELNASNEGLDTELHLTINGGSITINSDNDGINTNEDGVSVTTINGGNVRIFAGLGAEGDGIDSNGYLVINGGNVVSCAKPVSDAGLDSDLGSFIHGGTVIAMGSSMDWAESESGQVTMNLQFARQQAAGAEIRITAEDGGEVFTFKPEGDHLRGFSGLILSVPALTQGQTYNVYVDGVQMAYTGTDVMRGPGGFGGRPGGMGGMPGAFDPDNMPEGFDFENMPEGFDPESLPEGFEPGQMPEGFARPEGMEHPDGAPGSSSGAEPSTGFYMNDLVNFFSGVTAT